MTPRKIPPMPTVIKVGHKRYIVTHDNVRAGQHDGDAVIFPAHEEIVLRDDRSANTTANDLLHEVFHGCIDIAGLDGDSIKAADDPEEELVLRVTPWLLGVLRDNPVLVAFLVGGGA